MIAHFCGICLWLYTFVAICQVLKKMFWLEILHKILNYAFLKIQTQQTLKFDAAVCFLSAVY